VVEPAGEPVEEIADAGRGGVEGCGGGQRVWC
jgi:hypothetical protein